MERQRSYDSRINIPFNKMEELFQNGWEYDIELSIKECKTIDWIVFIWREDVRCTARKKKIRLCNIAEFGECCCKEFVGRKDILPGHVQSHLSKDLTIAQIIQRISKQTRVCSM